MKQRRLLCLSGHSLVWQNEFLGFATFYRHMNTTLSSVTAPLNTTRWLGDGTESE